MGEPNLVVAVDVGGTSAKAALCDRRGRLYGHRSVPLTHLRGQDGAVDAIVGLCADLVESDAATGAVGLAVPGIVDPVAGVAVSSMILGWHDVPFAELVGRRTGRPVAVGHDVRLAGHAEFTKGAGAGLTDALFVTLGSGVGAACLVDGRIYTGHHGLGGEIAHLVVDPDGPACRCGKNGCVEMIASAGAVADAYRAVTGSTAADAAAVARRAAAGEAAATAVWTRATTLLGRAISAYCELMDTQTVIVGGGMSSAGDILFEPLRRAVTAGVSLTPRPRVVPAALGPQAGIHGAALAAFTLLGARVARIRPSRRGDSNP